MNILTFLRQFHSFPIIRSLLMIINKKSMPVLSFGKITINIAMHFKKHIVFISSQSDCAHYLKWSEDRDEGRIFLYCCQVSVFNSPTPLTRPIFWYMLPH